MEDLGKTHPADQVQLGLDAIVVVTDGAGLARSSGVVGVDDLVGGGDDLVGRGEAEGEFLQVTLARAGLGLGDRARLASLGRCEGGRDNRQSGEGSDELHLCGM